MMFPLWVFIVIILVVVVAITAGLSLYLYKFGLGTLAPCESCESIIPVSMKRYPKCGTDNPVSVVVDDEIP